MTHSHSPLMVIYAERSEDLPPGQLVAELGFPDAHVVEGGIAAAISALRHRSLPPRFLLIDIGRRGHDVLAELDQLAEHCEADTHAVVIGTINDVRFYRELTQRGISDYFVRPVNMTDLRGVLAQQYAVPRMQAGDGEFGTVISFMSAASGDGSSTVALNTAYSLAHDFGFPTVVIDMDYQFGMIAKNLDLNATYGIKEIFEHPERGIDDVLVSRMLASYGEQLKVISAPNDLRMLPMIGPEIVRDLITTLTSTFKCVVIDLPHMWTPWVATTLAHSTHIVMVAQLWLRSVTHSSRLLSAWRSAGIDSRRVTLAVNRSGAKFKEAVSPKDYERVCGKTIDFYLANDIKTVTAAENEGKTLMEVGGSLLERQIKELAKSLVPDGAAASPSAGEIPRRKSFTGLFGKRAG